MQKVLKTSSGRKLLTGRVFTGRDVHRRACDIRLTAKTRRCRMWISSLAFFYAGGGVGPRPLAQGVAAAGDGMFVAVAHCVMLAARTGPYGLFEPDSPENISRR